MNSNHISRKYLKRENDSTMRYRAFWSFFLLSILVIAGLILPKSALFAGKTVNPSLNKAIVNSDTPFIVLGMGCFWGSEKRMQGLTGVLDVEAGYAGGDIANPSYETLHDTEAAINDGKNLKNHAEVVKVYYDPNQVNLEHVLIHFWENHNPAQGNRQGNDIGSNYRSAVFYRTKEERLIAEKTRTVYQSNLIKAGIDDPITTEITPLVNYASAEDYHQDYLEKNPMGYCGLGGTGVAYVDPALGNQHSTSLPAKQMEIENWDQVKLNTKEQLIAFEAVDCGYCRKFDKDVLANWENSIPPIHSTNSTLPPKDWKLSQALFATPTIVLFRDQQEVARYTGYQTADQFWQWLTAETTKLN